MDLPHDLMHGIQLKKNMHAAQYTFAHPVADASGKIDQLLQSMGRPSISS